MLALVATASAKPRGYLYCDASRVVTPGHAVLLTCWVYNEKVANVQADVIAISAQDALALQMKRKNVEDFSGWPSASSAAVTLQPAADGGFAGQTTLPAFGAYVIRFRAGDLSTFDQTRLSTIGVVTLASPDKRVYVPVDLRTFRVTRAARAVAFSKGTLAELPVASDGAFVRNVDPKDSVDAVYVEGTDGSVSFPEDNSYWYHRNQRGRAERVFVQTDRTMYRPGDRVFLRAIVRTGTVGTYQAVRTPVKLTVSGGEPRQNLAYRVLTPDVFGTINAEVRIPEDAALGDYYINVDGDNGGGFEIQAYKKPEYVIDIHPLSPYIVSGDTARFAVHAQYLFGVPAGGMKIAYFGDVQQYGEWGRYTPFQNNDEPSKGDYSSFSDAITTDAAGDATISVPTKALSLRGNLQLTLNARDDSGRTVATSTTQAIAPGTFDIAVAPQSWVVTAKTPSPVTVSTLNHDGSPRPHVAVRVRVVETEWKNGTWQHTDVGHVDLSSGNDGRAAFSFTPPHPGNYRFDAAARDERGDTVTSYAYEWSVDPESEWQPPIERPELISAKPLFRSGEQVHVTLAVTKRDSDAIVTISSDKLVERRIVHVSGYTTDIAFAPPKDAQRMNVQAFIPNEDGIASTQTAVAIAPVTQLSIALHPDKPSYRPGELATVRLHVADVHGRPVRAEVGIGVVDEGIFAMADQNLDPNGLFYDMVADTYSYANWYKPNRMLKTIAKVVSSSSGQLVKAGVTSDTYSVNASSEQGVPSAQALQRVALRSDFRDTAYWAPSVVSDARGDAIVRFRWPENLTTWRTTALGVTRRTQVGITTTKSVVTKPLLVRLETPRFLRAGDAASLTGIVHGKYAAEAVHMQLDATTLASPEPARSIVLDANRHASATWNVTAPGVGAASVSLRAIGRAGSDGMQVMVPLLGGTALVHTRDAGIAHSQVVIPLNLRPGELQGDVHLSFSPSALAELVQTMRVFDVYPYYCTEQTSSNAQVATAVLLASRAMPGVMPATDPKVVIDRAIARLIELRHQDGGWGWWESDRTNVDMTAYAVSTIAMIDETTGSDHSWLSEGGALALKTMLEAADTDRSSVAYAAYAIAQTHLSVPSALLARLRANVDSAKPYEAAMIGLTASALHDDTLAHRAAARLIATGVSNGGTMFWHDDRWTWSWWTDPIDATAYAVRLLEATNHAREAEAGLAFIRAQRNGDWWYTTKDTAAAAITLAQFERNTTASSTDETIRVLVDGNVARTVHLTQIVPDASDSRVVLPAASLQGAKAIVLDRSGSGNLYWSSDDVRYADRNEGQTRDASEAILTRLFAAPPPLRVSRRYTVDHYGAWRVGDEISVDLAITAPQGAQYVTIEDPFPAGVEYQPVQGQYGSGGYWWNGVQFLDDRAAFFMDGLPANYTIHLSYKLRATTPGTFAAPGPSAYASYGPPVTAVGAGEEVVIR